MTPSAERRHPGFLDSQIALAAAATMLDLMDTGASGCFAARARQVLRGGRGRFPAARAWRILRGGFWRHRWRWCSRAPPHIPRVRFERAWLIFGCSLGACMFLKLLVYSVAD